MVNIFQDSDKFDRVLYSEPWRVRYEEKEGECWIRKEKIYYLASKGSRHKQVKAKFKKDHKDCKIVAVEYYG